MRGSGCRDFSLESRAGFLDSLKHVVLQASRYRHTGVVRVLENIFIHC